MNGNVSPSETELLYLPKPQTPGKLFGCLAFVNEYQPQPLLVIGSLPLIGNLLLKRWAAPNSALTPHVDDDVA